MSAKLVKSIIQSNRIALFSKSFCPFCKLAKGVLNDAGVAPKDLFTVELDEREDGGLILSSLTSLTGVKTVPQVFVNQEFIGGGSDIEKLHNEGKLRELI